VSDLGAYGISVAIPRGWDGRAFRHADGEPTLHLGSFPLPRADGEFGSRATAAMPPDGLFLALTEYRVRPGDLETGLFAQPPPRAVDRHLLSDRALLRPSDGQRGLQRFFACAGRAFCLYVVVGRDGARHVTGANDALASLRFVPLAHR
jgi:hypothetical protein